MSLGAPPPRSWLFVPADSNKKMMKALESDADAIIFDLEDSVVPAQKPIARELLTLLPERRDGEPERWVRINPLGTDDHREDLDLLEDLDIDGVVLPKAECGDDVADLAAELAPRSLPIHAIVTETAASLFGLRSYHECCSSLVGNELGRGGFVGSARSVVQIFCCAASLPSPTGWHDRSAWPARSRPRSSLSTASTPTSATKPG